MSDAADPRIAGALRRSGLDPRSGPAHERTQEVAWATRCSASPRRHDRRRRARPRAGVALGGVPRGTLPRAMRVRTDERGLEYLELDGRPSERTKKGVLGLMGAMGDPDAKPGPDRRYMDHV